MAVKNREKNTIKDKKVAIAVAMQQPHIYSSVVKEIAVNRKLSINFI